jgi:hypothetical protein
MIVHCLRVWVASQIRGSPHAFVIRLIRHSFHSFVFVLRVIRHSHLFRDRFIKFKILLATVHAASSLG